jgi:hypothetical protein
MYASLAVSQDGASAPRRERHSGYAPGVSQALAHSETRSIISRCSECKTSVPTLLAAHRTDLPRLLRRAMLNRCGYRGRPKAWLRAGPGSHAVTKLECVSIMGRAGQAG